MLNLKDTIFEFEGDTFAYFKGALHKLSEDDVELVRGQNRAAQMWDGVNVLARAVMTQEAKALDDERKAEQRARKRFNYKRRQLKELAAKLALDSWGVLQDGSATPVDYLVVEQMLKDTGCLDEVLLPVFEEEVAGWNVRNPQGTQTFTLYPQGVPHLLALSRRDPERLRIVLELGCTAFGGSRFEKLVSVLSYSNTSLLQVIAGETWLRSIDPQLAARCKFEVLRMLGRTPERLRWSLIQKLRGQGYRNGSPVILSKLDWALYMKAKVNPAVRFSTFPPVVQWEKLLGVRPQEGLGLAPLEGFKVGVFRKLCSLMELDPTQREMGGLGNAQALFSLVRLFGDEEAIRRFVAARGFEWTTKGLHDAGQFSLSARRGWTPAKWSPLCLRHPEVVRWASDFPKLEAAGVVPQTLSEFRTERLKLGYPNVRPGSEALASYCLDAGLTGEAFAVHQDFWEQVTVKPAEFLPHIEVLGSEVGLPPGWRLSKLRATDYRGPMLGELTGCCQHLQGAGRASAEHGVTSPFSAFYVVTHDNKVIAQSWAWLNCVEGLVFDSIESKVRTTADLQPVFQLFEAASERLLRAALGIKGVHVGATSSGVTAQYLAYLRSKRSLPRSAQHAAVDYGGYYDGTAHILVAGKSVKKQRNLPKVEDYKCQREDDSFAHSFAEFQEFLEHDAGDAIEWLQARPELAQEWGISREHLFWHMPREFA